MSDDLSQPRQCSVPNHRPEYGDTPGWAVPTSDPRITVADCGAGCRPDYEQVVTDILVGLGARVDLRDGPDVDEARAAVMRELGQYFGEQSDA